MPLRCSAIWYNEICQGKDKQPDPDLTNRIFHEGLRGDLQAEGCPYGLVLDVGGYYKNAFTLAPYLEITYQQIDLGIELLDQLFARFEKPGLSFFD